MSDTKTTTLVDGIVTVIRKADLWALDLSTASGVKLHATSQRPDARDALLAIADSLNTGIEPYLIDTLSRSERSM